MNNKDVLKLIKDEEADYVDIRFTDPRGKLQHVTVIVDEVNEDWFEDGFMFDGSSIAGWKSIDQSDMKLIPDTKSAYLDPFYAEKTLCIHCIKVFSIPLNPQLLKIQLKKKKIMHLHL